MDLEILFTGCMLGAGLAMDAFSVSLANGLNEPRMKPGKMCGIAGIFAFFQALMPLIGWFCVCTVAQCFSWFEALIPWIALGLLGYIGGKMLIEGIRNQDGDREQPAVGFLGLVVQGVATSIDALSTGFTISDYDFFKALKTVLVIAAMTFVICVIGVAVGKKVGTKLAGKASILGGVILIGIGLYIFIGSWF